MWCLTQDECKQWADGRYFGDVKYLLTESGHPSIDGLNSCVCAPFAKISWTRLHWLSRYLCAHVEPFDECLLWVTESGIWDENLHLFYRMRETYGERRSLGNAPGHLFLSHESADLTTFILLAILNGWDFCILPSEIRSAAFVSHDEYVDFYFQEDTGGTEIFDLLPGARRRDVQTGSLL